MPPDFTCTLCNKQFNRKFTFQRHQINVHKLTLDATKNNKGRFSCPLCSFTVPLRVDFVQHCLKVHDIPTIQQTLHFRNENEFQSWKKDTEKSSKTFFVSRSKGYETRNPPCKITEVRCNRSGFFKPKSVGHRKTKTQGTRKINGFCPCGIKIKRFGDGTVTAIYCSTHIGHDLDLAHIPLTREERLNIATKMANKIPLDEILDDVRPTVDQQELDRLHLLTKQDLYNIKSEFELNDDTVCYSNEAIGVDAWVRKEKMSPSNCVLFYKPQNETIDDIKYTTFKKEDFALAILTEAQEEILKKYGDDCVCIDRTHSLNAYDFEVVTLLVLDDMKQGFPCAFFICNRIDSDTISTFFAFIKERVGDIQPSVFMSDLEESLYNGWELVMGPVEKRLYCTWHIDRAWQANLTTIKDEEKRKEAHNKVRSLLEETDESTFLAMLLSITKSLCSDETTKEYGEYFVTYYGWCYERWAYCYRVNAGLNTNRDLEQMHRTINYLFSKCKTTKSLNNSINGSIMQTTKQKLCDCLKVLNKEKLTLKLKELRSRHQSSLEMNSDLIVENRNNACWAIGSSSGSQVYIVSEVNTNCDCRIVCKPCSACLHKYSCTCDDASIDGNMCKHIHLLCRKLNSEESTACPQPNDKPLLSDNEIYWLEIDDSLSVENIAVFEEVGTAEIEAFEEKKKELREHFEMLVDQMTTIEDFEFGEQALNSLQSKLSAIDKSSKFLELCPHDEHIEPQRAFLPLKKKNKKKVPLSRQKSRPKNSPSRTTADSCTNEF